MKVFRTAVITCIVILFLIVYLSGCSLDTTDTPKFQEYNALAVNGGACAPSHSDLRTLISVSRNGDTEAFESLTMQGKAYPLSDLTGVHVLSVDDGIAAGIILTGTYIKKLCYMPVGMLTTQADIDAAVAEAQTKKAAKKSTRRSVK